MSDSYLPVVSFIFFLSGKQSQLLYMPSNMLFAIVQSNGTLYKEHRGKDRISGFWPELCLAGLPLTCSIIARVILCLNLCIR